MTTCLLHLHQCRPPLWLVLACIIPLSSCTEQQLPDSLVGAWSTRARVGIRYTLGFNSYRFVKDTVDITLEIRKDRTVLGRIGNAALEKCRIEKNRGMIAKTLDLFSDYVIKGDLRGRIFPADTLETITISVPLNADDNAITGTIFQAEGPDIYPMVNFRMTQQR